MLVNDNLKFNNRLYITQLEECDPLIDKVLQDIKQGKRLCESSLPINVNTYHNAIKKHWKDLFSVSLWDSITHVKVTDWNSTTDINSNQHEGNIIYETKSSQRVVRAQSNPYILAYQIYGQDDSGRSGDGAWGSVYLCTDTVAANGLKVSETKQAGKVVFLQFELEVL